MKTKVTIENTTKDLDLPCVVVNLSQEYFLVGINDNSEIVLTGLAHGITYSPYSIEDFKLYLGSNFHIIESEIIIKK